MKLQDMTRFDIQFAGADEETVVDAQYEDSKLTTIRVQIPLDEVTKHKLEECGASWDQYEEVGKMFKDADGKWYPFVNKHHERATIEAGYEVRSIYVKES